MVNKERVKVIRKSFRETLAEKRNKLIIDSMLYQGLSVAEMLTLTMGDIDLTEGKITVNYRGIKRTQRVSSHWKKTALLWLVEIERSPYIKNDCSTLVFMTVRRGGRITGNALTKNAVHKLMRDIGHTSKELRDYCLDLMIGRISERDRIRRIALFFGWSLPYARKRIENSLAARKVN